MQFLSFNIYVRKFILFKDWDVYFGGFIGGSIEFYGGYNIWFVNGRLYIFN